MSGIITGQQEFWRPQAQVRRRITLDDIRVPELRPSQKRNVDAIGKAIARGHKRIMLCAPTGSGKTVIAIYLTILAMLQQKRVLFAVDRRSLALQTSDRFAEYLVPHGMIMAGSFYGRLELARIASMQTLEASYFPKDIDVLFVDEAHIVRKKMEEYILSEERKGKLTIGLSATPMTAGIGNTYTTVVNLSTTDELIKAGELCPLKIFCATPIDMSGVVAKGVGGEWSARQVRERGSVIVGDIVASWIKYTKKEFGKAVKTLAFVPDVAYAKILAEKFLAAGYDYRVGSFRDSDKESEMLVSDFRNGMFTGLISVEKFVKGFDVPDVECIIAARPYRKSHMAVLQQYGRGMRKHPGKEFCLVLDHCGNAAGWQMDTDRFFAEGIKRLSRGKTKRRGTRREIPRSESSCRGCGLLLAADATQCPSCGMERPQRRTRTVVIPGRMEHLEEIRPEAKGSRKWLENKIWVFENLCKLATEFTNLSQDHQRAERFVRRQYHTLYGEWPPRAFVFGYAQEGDLCDRRVKRKVLQLLKAYQKQRKGFYRAVDSEE